MDDVNTISFRLIDPRKAGEAWADDYPETKAVEIYIDDKEILDILRPIEEPYAKAEGLDLENDYGHIDPKSLYSDLTEATDPNSYAYSLGVYLCRCGDCGEPGCWSVTNKVREDEDYVYWYGFQHEHRDWEYNLEYKFDKKQYVDALRELEAMAKGQR